MLMAGLGVGLTYTQELPNKPFIKQEVVWATMEELNCNLDYTLAFEKGLLQSRLMEEKSGKPAFGREQLLNAIQKIGDCHSKIAANTLLAMQFASIKPNDIDLSQVTQTMEDIGCSPGEAVMIMHNRPFMHKQGKSLPFARYIDRPILG